MTKIFIDPGHGGNDPGAVANGLREKDLTLTISKRIKAYLDNNYSGHNTRLSRTGDTTMSLSQRTNAANNWGADYFLSVHINAGGGTGYEDYIYSGGVSSKTASIRNTIHAEVVKQISNVRNRGKKRANFHVVRETRMPAMLTENLFIDTKADADLLKSNAFLDKVATGHANGLIKAFNLKGTVNKPTTSKPKAKAPSKSKPTQSSANLTVDGKWGKSTTRALQKALNTPVDGIISKQPRNSVSQSLYGGTVQFGSGSSNVIVALQRKVGASADGKLGPTTIRSLQRYLGTVQDGVLSRPSLVVKELQRRLNAGTF